MMKKTTRQISAFISMIMAVGALLSSEVNAQNMSFGQSTNSPVLAEHGNQFNDFNNMTARRNDRNRYPNNNDRPGHNNHKPGNNRPDNNRPDRNQGQYGDRLYCELTDGAVALNNRVYYINDLKFHINRKTQEVKYLDIEARNTLQTIGSVRLIAYDGVVGICNSKTQSDKDCAFLVGNYDTYQRGDTKRVVAMSYFITGMLTCRFY